MINYVFLNSNANRLNFPSYLFIGVLKEYFGLGEFFKA